MIDDHLLFAEAIRLSLVRSGMGDVRIVSRPEDALPAAKEDRPDLVLVDISLPGRSGIAVGSEILQVLPETRVVALTAREDPQTVKEALRAGFHGYLSKRAESTQFRRALDSVLDGHTVFPHRLGARTATDKQDADDPDLLASQLTTREVEVLQLLAEGASSREISRRLSVSPNTVRTHVQGILTKLQVHSRLEAAAFAVRHDVVKLR
jgi:two-component system nitrate/nitrite response regulator NarL